MVTFLAENGIPVTSVDGKAMVGDFLVEIVSNPAAWSSFYQVTSSSGWKSRFFDTRSLFKFLREKQSA